MIRGRIRTAEIREYESVLDFYNRLIDDLQGRKCNPRWRRGAYPEPEAIREAIRDSELFICEESGEIAAAMRINHEGAGGYEKVSWAVDAAKEEVAVIHMLGVAASYQRQGIGKRMVQFAIDQARDRRQKAVRLDVLVGNIPANRLYESMGFECRGRVSLRYEDISVTDFELYELVLEDIDTGYIPRPAEMPKAR